MECETSFEAFNTIASARSMKLVRVLLKRTLIEVLEIKAITTNAKRKMHSL